MKKENKICDVCGGKIAISSKGNLYCTNICWKKKKYSEARENIRLANIEYQLRFD